MPDPKRPKVTPHQLDMFTEPIVEIYRALEEEIFHQIAKKLKTSKELGQAEVLQWQAEKMQQLRILNNDTIKSLSKTTGIADKEIRRAIQEAVIGTIESTDEEIQGIYKANDTNIPFIPEMPSDSFLDEIMTSYVNQTFREFDNFVNQTLITTNFGEGTVTRMYRRIVEETTAKVLAGTTTVNKAVAETVIKWANKGIETAFVDRGGHTWTLERYADTVVRSTVNRAYNEQRTSRMGDYGVTTVLVSSLPNPRESCSHIQGKVADIRPIAENDSNYPSIYEFGYGQPSGLRGIHCRHMFFAWIEGLSTNNQPQYTYSQMTKNRELSQKQRYYERQVRKNKRSLKIAEEIGDVESIDKYKKLVRNSQERVREFVREHKLVRRYDKERILAPVSRKEVASHLLPNYKNAIIPDAKLTKYALDPNGKAPDKAIAFERALGYNKENYKNLIENVIENLPKFMAVPKTKDQWGQRYEVRMRLTGPNGKTANVLTAWIQDSSTGEMKLTSIYVK